jgi:hypothetical protein
MEKKRAEKMEDKDAREIQEIIIRNAMTRDETPRSPNVRNYD